MKTKETIKQELFVHFSGGSLADEYYQNEKVCQIMKESCQEWEESDPETAADILDKATNDIFIAFYGNAPEPFDESRINKESLLQDWGINIDSLRENGDLERMLNHGRSGLITAYPVLAGVCFSVQIKLSLRLGSNGDIVPIPHPIRKEPQLNEYRGYKFTDDDRKNLLTTGNLGHTITINSNLLEFRQEVYISLDKETNEIVQFAKKHLSIPETINGVALTPQQRKSLETGAPTPIADAVVQVNAVKRGLETIR